MPSLPVVPEAYSHVLAEFDCLDPLLAALRLDSGRLKCTCLAVSRKWLALGTSAGGLHLIQREGWKQRLILTHKEGSITQVACCPHDDDFVAVATSQGLVVVWELQLERRGRPERVSVSWEHRGGAVTALCWDSAALRVFVGDAGGKVSFLRAGSSKLGKGSAFVIFPVQTITTVDSRVVQLGFQDNRLLVSSLSRCYLCDTEREKFWRVGNKERDGEYGACFFPQGRGLGASQPPLLYCARPGSRVWEANFSGEVLSTHQFKQLLACPSLPLISYRCDPQYSPAQRRPQSIAFPRLLCLSDQNLLTWTDSAMYIFVPQSGQVLLWTEIKDVVDVAVFRSELFCLHGDGRLSHLSLLPAERCAERLLRRESWPLAAAVCCMFQHAVAPCRVRKILPIDRLEYLRSQLSNSTHQDLISQLEEVIAKLEPLDSASSSRRSSISSHESFNVLDCGIYRVISRRGSQSDEETSSLVSQSMLEEERLKEFSFIQEDEPVDQDQPPERPEPDRSEAGLQFHLPLSFRPKPPRVALQAVRDSVSSFVKKTTEKINTLQMNSELWARPDLKEGGQSDVAVTSTPISEERDEESSADSLGADTHLQELREATDRAISQVQDPVVLLDPACLGEVLQEWLPVLERVLGPHDSPPAEENPPGPENPLEPGCEGERPDSSATATEGGPEERDEARPGREGAAEGVPGPQGPEGGPAEPIRVTSPQPVPSNLLADLSQLASLSLDLGRFHGGASCEEGACSFLRRYFFLLDPERMQRACAFRYRDLPAVREAYIAGLLELTRSSPVVPVIEKGDLLKSLRTLRELQPWTPPPLLAHLHRLYEKHGELAVRSFAQFYPTILPSDVMAMANRSHFLAYLDNLVHSRAEEQRLSFLGSLLQPESLRQEWLELALSHDAPQKVDTLTLSGQPRWRSHLFRWGYGRLLSLLIQLPADLASKQKMAETCKSFGYWTGYLSLCCQLQRRPEAFATICSLDDLSLLEGPNGINPETLEEWKLLLQLSQQQRDSPDPAPDPSPGPAQPNGNGLSNGSCDSRGQISPESLVLRLARIIGPDRAIEALEDCGICVELGPRSSLICELLRMAEKRQRALIQTMLERCDRFLWSQQA
ncbi:Hermansky-Pudlak syndrome 5 protein isoform X1 [Anguilla anguilla]|uniref:Hermansky-Pudlak syndrome 5 protein isoform X1 n=1 Tax=Anguilla anguilla TaxID=7936 RepID=UPI0015ACC07A|nr:Hermansky-Pudlak syndrome 5 protein isoform X1 [Anguilla anguilla]XP_035251536.1 Hermansky-Pudlak syndrome 5 protein isoform X2 [Anguilla anguilla]XP_035251537.1 Hermansky-Pudlak syndrome 5 protein isoform X1 [Anguilla anguilla]